MDGERYLREAVALAVRNVEQGGRPFGAVVVKDGEIIARGVNEIGCTGDPTSHAELNAIRAASQVLGTPSLEGCAVYASGHPCPMCMAAMRMTGVAEVAYAYSNEDGKPYGLSTVAIYEDLARPRPEQTMKVTHRPVRVDGADPYRLWRARRG